MDESAVPMREVVLPVPLINGALLPHLHPTTVSLIVLPLPLKYVPILEENGPFLFGGGILELWPVILKRPKLLFLFLSHFGCKFVVLSETHSAIVQFLVLAVSA
jgi:hypothetical protein